MNVIRNKLKRSELFISVYDKIKQEYYKRFVSDTRLIKREFRDKVGREVNLENPLKYNDKIQWLKLNWQNSIATNCADKYTVREIISKKIGSEYLNELYAIYESVEEIDLSVLPNKFVLKGTHGSGFNIICRDKNKMDWDDNFKNIKRWLNRNYFWFKRESIYKNIKPRIICEKLLVQNDADELRDYRFFCFNGEPKFITVDFSITDKKKTRRNLYDLEWNIIDAEISYPRETHIKVPKPEKLKEMIELSRNLSSEFPHVRIDFYYINKKIIFGEITFFHQSGMGKIIPEEFELKMGSWLTLPKKI